jgi:hypothetical protein
MKLLDEMGVSHTSPAAGKLAIIVAWSIF